ncbi:MAG: hypothetical protein ABJN36_17600 [Cyclobacteriaceae bacterium]
MKLVLKAYIEALKEDNQLDKLLTDLLWSMNLNNLTKIKKGRQYGVDIAAFGPDPEDNVKKVFLFAVKQGDFTRKNWDVGTNSIRPTLGEILNTYLPTSLNSRYQKYPKKIIVACNGYLDQNVNIDWTQFINQNGVSNLIEFDFWGLEKIVSYVESYMLSEMLFPESYQILLRKTLSFLDLPDYDLRHFHALVTRVLEANIETKVDKRLMRNLKLIPLLSSILHKWCIEMDNLKPSIIASERTLLVFYDFIRKRSLFEEKEVLHQFMSMHAFKTQINREYLAKIQHSFYIEDGLAFKIRNHSEYCLMTFEQIGIVATIGLTELFETQIFMSMSDDTQSGASELCYQAACHISQGLGELIVNNPSAYTPKYDEHCIDINLAMILFYNTERYDYAGYWLENLITYLRDAFMFSGFIPLFYTSHDRLIQIELGNEKAEINSSMLITSLAEWCIILKRFDLYTLLHQTIEEYFPEIDLQLWHPEIDTEDHLFTTNAMNETGSTRNTTKMPKKAVEYEMEMAEEPKIFFNEAEMEHNKKGMGHLEYIANRHFRSYVFPNSWRSLLSTRFCFNSKN